MHEKGGAEMHEKLMQQYEVTERNGATQHRAHLRQTDSRRMPPGWLLDKIADEKLNGGYSAAQRRNVCPNCFEARSLAGTCGC